MMVHPQGKWGLVCGVALICQVFTTTEGKGDFIILNGFNAVPSGDYKISNKGLEDCEDLCSSSDDCNVFAFNVDSNHCFISDATSVVGVTSDHVISGCNPEVVHKCIPMPQNKTVPTWTTQLPNASEPVGGYTQLDLEFKTEIFHATNGTNESLGTYNHNCMLDYLHGSAAPLSAYWKNCQVDEDCDGQRILFSQSTNGKSWSFPVVLFPNLTTNSLQAVMEPGPFIHINGRLYAGASPGIYNRTHDASAQGSQFCLWPDPLNPRNCGPPSRVAVQYNSTLLMREILPMTQEQLSQGMSPLGKMFWASPTTPTLFADVTKELDIPALPQMDVQTQHDLDTLVQSQSGITTTCSPSSDGTLKCEACAGGCQHYASIDFSLGIANERTHWMLPGGDSDVIAYRSNDHTLWASIRKKGDNGFKESDWPSIARTNIPNDNSNLNAGSLPNGSVYLVHNPVTPTSKPPMMTSNGVNGTNPSGRDPVTIAISHDGLDFTHVGAVLTCRNFSATSLCLPRHQGKSKNPGPSYPQALTVMAPAPQELQGMYVIASNNKEDIWIAKVAFENLPGFQ